MRPISDIPDKVTVKFYITDWLICKTFTLCRLQYSDYTVSTHVLICRASSIPGRWFLRHMTQFAVCYGICRLPRKKCENPFLLYFYLSQGLLNCRLCIWPRSHRSIVDGLVKLWTELGDFCFQSPVPTLPPKPGYATVGDFGHHVLLYHVCSTITLWYWLEFSNLHHGIWQILPRKNGGPALPVCLVLLCVCL